MNDKERTSELPLLTEAERHQLLVEWNKTWSEYPKDKCIHQLFEEQAERTPDNIAVVFEGQQLTYWELNCQANQLANYLRSLGVKSEVLVALCVERSLEMVVGILGILKAGGAYLPIDPNYPSDRIAYMLKDSQLPVLLTQKKLVASLPEHQVQVICLDADCEEISKESEDSPTSDVTPENLAYIIYTSGSTGNPKGVAVPHRAVNRLVLNTNYINLQPLDVVAFASNFSFDAATFEIWGALLNGAKLVVIAKDVALSPYEFATQIHQQGISVLLLTTALFNLLAREVPSAIQSVRHLLFGGEVVEPKWVKEVLNNGSPQRLLHVYGPTENTTFTSWYLVEDVPEEATTISIGRPIANTQVYILDTQLMPVPVGVPGELYIGGDGLARGYLNRPDLTQEKFIPNPFSDEPSERLYKTGDLARYLPDGNIEFIGRVDSQVKIRGFRIELGEIETTLGKHIDVAQAVVVVREDIPGDKRLVAYVVPKTIPERLPDRGQSIDYLLENQGLGKTWQATISSSCRRFLEEKLPSYMLPSSFMLLTAMPLTPNGKVDRKALSIPDSSRANLQAQFTAPSTPVEETLARIWAEVLHLKTVGVDDNFLDLGGHSLLAIQIISRIRDSLGIELAIRVLFEAPTVRELADRLNIAGQEQQGIRLPSIQPVSREEQLPLSFSQEQLWFLAQLAPESPFYNEPAIVPIDGSVDIPALERSLNELIQRHEALRTQFAIVNGKPIQVIQQVSEFKLSVINLKDISEAKREVKALEIATEQARKPFDITSDLLLRITLIQLSNTDFRLCLTLHHIIIDGVSLINIFLPELATLYQAFSTGKTVSLPELPIQYADFAYWQQNCLERANFKQQLAYWKEQLRDLPVLQLPTDYSRPTTQTFEGAKQYLELSNSLTKKLSALSRQYGATLYMTLLAAFKILLARYARQEDIVVGTGTAGRNCLETERVIGFFLNTIVLRTNLSGNPRFNELLLRVKETTLAANAHTEIPFDRVVKEIQPDRHFGENPLFQVAFVLEPPATPIDLGWEFNQVVDTGTAKFDLTLQLEERAEGLLGYFEYNTDLFNADTVKRMVGHFQILLEGIVNNPDTPIFELPLLTTAEQQQLREWNQTETEYPTGLCIHQLIETMISSTPDAIAVVFADVEKEEMNSLTYRELNYRANQLAHYLQLLGVGTETLVGLCVERSIEMIVAILGILKAGAAYVPIDPNYPSERIEYMLNDARVPILLTQTPLIDFLPPHEAHVICLDKDWEVIAQNSQETPITNVTPDNLAYVIYTSGSTGKPKGVMVTHQGLGNLALAQQKQFNIHSASRILQFASLSFDASVWEIIMALVPGATLVLGTRYSLLPGKSLIKLLREQEISIVVLPPSVLALLPYEDLPALQTIIAAGEACSSELIARWGESRQFFNAYGPTEATVYATLAQCTNEMEKPPIGRPIDNVQVYLLDALEQPVPIGIPGELHIASVGLARGYLNRPDLTAERFIPNPFSDKPSARLYKTGDLARYLPDGNIEFLGRIDHQVKIRGFRIELGEIEAALAEHPDVQQAVVIVREDIPGNKSLAAYLVLKAMPKQAPYQGEGVVDLPPNDLLSKQTLIENLRCFLSQKLPNYMIPAHFAFLDSLPLTPNGKVDRKALQALPVVTSAQIHTEKQLPRTPVEKQLAAIWQEVLRIDNIGVTDNFFALGGHSLLAMQVVGRISQHFQIQMAIRELFEKPTIAMLAECVVEQSTIQEDFLPKISASDERSETVISYGQKQYWWVDYHFPNTPLYNLPFVTQITGELNITALECSFQEIVRRHEPLRTTFAQREDGVIQVINSVSDFSLKVKDLRGEVQTEADIHHAIQKQLYSPVNLSEGPLFRAAVWRLAEDKYLLVIIVHHIIFDGWSSRLMYEELELLYEAFCQGKPNPLPAMTTTYRDYSRWQQEWVHSQACTKQLMYWKQQLKGVPEQIIWPNKGVSTKQQILDGTAITIKVPQALTNQLKTFSQEQGVTIFMTMLASYKQLIANYTGQCDLVIGFPIGGRYHPVFENLIGCFINLLPSRTNLSGAVNFKEVLQRVKQTTLEAFDRQQVPFARIVDVTGVDRRATEMPLFNVAFNMLDEFSLPQLKLADTHTHTWTEKPQLGKLDLMLTIKEHGDDIYAEWEYRTRWFDEDTVQGLVKDWLEILSALASVF